MIKEVKEEKWSVSVAVRVMYENILDVMQAKNLSGELVQYNNQGQYYDYGGFWILKNNVCCLHVYDSLNSTGVHSYNERIVHITGPNENLQDYIEAVKMVPCITEDYYVIIGRQETNGLVWNYLSFDGWGCGYLLEDQDKVVCRLKNGKYLHCVFVQETYGKKKGGYFVDVNASKLFGEGVEVRVNPEKWSWETWFKRSKPFSYKSARTRIQ